MSQFQCVLHGSFQKHFPEIQRIHRLFTSASVALRELNIEPNARYAIELYAQMNDCK